MARWIVAGLVVLNLVLGVGVYLRIGGEKAAYAQIGAGRSYVTVAGTINNDNIIYVLESSTGRLAAIRVNPVDRKVCACGHEKYRSRISSGFDERGRRWTCCVLLI